MVNRILQHPPVKQPSDRAIEPSAANSLLYILSAIRELFNTSGDGQNTVEVRHLGYYQLVDFLYNTLWMSEEEITQQHQRSNNLGRFDHLNGLGSFIRWGTSCVLDWAGSDVERLAAALEVFGPVDQKLCVYAMEWQKTLEEDPHMGDLEASRFRTLLSLLSDSFAILGKHHAAVDNYHHDLGFREIRAMLAEADLMLEPYHHYTSEVWTWAECEGHTARVQETLPLLLAVLGGAGGTASCFRVEHALAVFLPVMLEVVDVVYDVIPGQLWVETLEEAGLTSLSALLGREFGLRNDRRLGMNLRGKLGEMLGNRDEEMEDAGEGEEGEDEDVGVQFGQLRLEDGRA